MKLKLAVIAALASLASAGSMAFSSSTFGGQHDTVEAGLGAYGSAASFVDIFSFSLGSAGTVVSTTTALGVSFATYGLFGVGVDTTAGTFDDVLFGATGLGAPGSLSVALGSGSYYYKVSGIASATGGAYALSSTVTPVPEPETYAMMLAGLAAVGFLARRRQNG